MSWIKKASAAALVVVGLAGLSLTVAPRGGAAPSPDSTLVHVTNRIIDAVPVNPSPARPYHVTVGVNLADGSFADGAGAPLPAGQRFVIQTVTASAVLPAGQRPRLTVSTQLVDSNGDPGVLADHCFAFSDQGLDEGGRACFTLAQPVTLYSDAGGLLQGYFSRNSTVGFGEMRATFSGYLTKATKPPGR